MANRKAFISIQTTFDWRHEILSSLAQFIPEQLADEIECDELELPINEKGNKDLKRKARKRSSDFKRNQGKEVVTIRVVTAVSRSRKKILTAVVSKRLNKKK